ncbi:MAG: chitin deacetylase family protein [Chloroflexota bacterium]|nr:chitin deacetylase family protein [Chloroflexota bacterium]
MRTRELLAVPVGLSVLGAAALVRPGPVVRWLARRYPDVLFFVETGERLVALTIDDAPHPALTPAILDVLAAHGARATFFLFGGRVPGNEGIVRRIVAEGHELGNHLMTDAPSIRLPADAFERQLRQTHDLLAPFGQVRWFRPGSGWFNRRMLAQLLGHDYRCALGSAYAYDTHIRSARYVSGHVLRHARPGAVIILHDGGESRRQTLAVLGRVLPELARRGYRVVTLSELTELAPAPRAAVHSLSDAG